MNKKRGPRIAQRWHIQSTAKIEKRYRLNHLFKKVMKKTPVLPSKEKEEERRLVDSSSKPSIIRTILIWGEAVRNTSLNKGSLKQLLPVPSN